MISRMGLSGRALLSSVLLVSCSVGAVSAVLIWGAVANSRRQVLDQAMIMLHPIMPFITEELWAQTGTREKMLVHADWPTYAAADLVDAEADHEINWVIALIESIRSARAQGRKAIADATTCFQGKPRLMHLL